jgi:hypothetical protein
MSQNGVVASIYVLGRSEAVDELFDFDFFTPDYVEEGGPCREDCLKVLEGRLGHCRNVEELPFPTTEDDEDDPPKPFALKGRIVC